VSITKIRKIVDELADGKTDLEGFLTALGEEVDGSDDDTGRSSRHEPQPAIPDRTELALRKISAL
jgi:hypothetical protein